MDRIDELGQKFPEIPRPIIVKMDVLREAIRLNPLALEVGRWAIPEYLPWDRDVHKGYRDIESELVGDDWAWLPHSMTFPEGITAKVVYDFIRHHESPYELCRRDGAIWLCRNGEPVTEVDFEARPAWLARPAEDGRALAGTFSLSSADHLLGFPVRFCAHYQPDDICRFCCLNPAGKNIAAGDGLHDVILSPDAAAGCLAAALDEMDVRHVTLTGGALKDQHKEAEIYARVVEAIARVRDERGADLSIQAMPTALDDGGQVRLHDAGADEISFNMEVWEERLWPEVVPGKQRHIGRTAWLERLERAAKRFGRGRAMTQFVIGAEMVSGAFASFDEAIRSVLAGIEWCAERGIQPDTTTWFNTPGSVYEPRTAPPTEYFLTVAVERHRILERHGMYLPVDARPNYSAVCHRCGYLSPDADFQWLLARDLAPPR